MTNCVLALRNISKPDNHGADPPPPVMLSALAGPVGLGGLLGDLYVSHTTSE